MAQLRCPICDRPFDSDKSDSMPFCSPTCREIDLSRWLDEAYGFPYEGNETVQSTDYRDDDE